MEKFRGLLASKIAEAEVVPLTALIHPDAAMAMAFWRNRPADGLRIGRDVPSRSIARLLSRVAVCEPTAGGDDFRVRLSGGTINERFERDITGEYVSGMFADPSERKARLDGMIEAVAMGETRMARIVHHAGKVELLRFEGMVVPVTAPNGNDRWALVFAFYF